MSLFGSDVRCIIYGDAEKLDAFIAASLIIGTPAFDEFKEMLRRYNTTLSTGDACQVLELLCEDVKWNPSYSEVQSWMDLFPKSADFGLEYEFIRVGVENGDVERHESDNSWSMLYTTQPTILSDIPEPTDDKRLPLFENMPQSEHNPATVT